MKVLQNPSFQISQLRGGWDLERWQGTSSVKAATITHSSLMCDMLKQVYVNGHLFVGVFEYRSSEKSQSITAVSER